MSESTPYNVAEKTLRALTALLLPLLIVAFTFATPDPTLDLKRLLLMWGAGLLGGGWLLSSWWFKVPFRRPPIFFGMLMTLWLLWIVATVPSPFPWISAMSISRLFGLIVIYVVASQVYRTEAQIRVLLLAACLGMMLAAAYAYMQAAGLDPIPWEGKDTDVYKDLPGFFGHPNFAAHALVVVIPFSVYLALTGWRWAGLFTITFLVYLAATSQRGAWLGLAGAAVLVAIAWLAGRRLKNPYTGIALSISGTGVAGLAGLAAIAGWSMLRSGVAFPIEHSLLLRYQGYVSAGAMFLDRIFLGHGPGVYGLTNPLYWSQFEQQWFAQERRMNAHVHNDLMEFGIDAGMLSAGLYLSLLLAGIAYGLYLAFTADEDKRRRLGYLFAAVFTAFAIDGLFGFNYYVPVSAALFFLSMGMLDGQILQGRPAPKSEASWAPALRWAMGGLLVVLVVFESRLFSAQLDLQMGLRLQSAGNYADAEQVHLRGLGKAPWDWNFNRQIGHARASRGDLAGAIAAYERVLEQNPHYLLTRLPLAHTKMRAAQLYLRDHPGDAEETLRLLDAAAQDLHRALELCPMLPEAHQIMAEISGVSALVATSADGAEKPGRAESYWRTAENHLELAVEYKLDDMDQMYRQLAQVRVALNDLAGAEKALTEAVRRDPHNTSMWPTFLEYVLKYGRFDQARNVIGAQIRQLESETPVDTDALATTKMFLGNLLENGYDDLDGALAAYAEAARLQPGRPEVWTNYARFARQRNRMDEFRSSVMQAVRDAGEAKDVLPGPLLAADLYLRTGIEGLYNASGILLAAVRSYKADPDGLKARDAAAWAVDLLQEAAQPLPIEEHCMTVFNIGLCRNALEQYDLARGLLQMLDECIPADQASAYALHYADTLTGFGQSEEALAVLERAVNNFPDDLELRWALARNLSRLQNFGRAREIYEDLLAEQDLDVQGRRMLEAELGALPQP